MKQENIFFKKLMSFAIAVLMCLGAVSIVTADDTRDGDNRSIDDSDIYATTIFYEPDITMDLEFELYVQMTGCWLTYVELDFPTGVTVNSATDISGIQWLNPTGETGDGIVTTWGEPDSTAYGYATSGTHAFTVNVDITPSFTGDMVINYFLETDHYGSEPWTDSGTVTIQEEPEWEGHKMHFPQLPDPLGWDVFAMMPENILADDFLCTGTGPMTDLHFWGSWFEDIIPEDPIYGAPFGFHISFHEDIPAEESPTGYSMPGAELWVADINFPDFECIPMDPSPQGWLEPPDAFFEDNHMQYFQYNINFDEIVGIEPFNQTEGEIYWVDIAPFTDPGFLWGWKTTEYHWNDDAVYLGLSEVSVNLLDENFDGTWSGSPAAPDGWTVINNNSDSYYWSQANTYISPTHSEPYAAHGMGNTDDWLITPEIDLTDTDATLKWWDKVESMSYPNSYKVLVSTTTNDTSSFTDELGDYDCTNTDWTEHAIDLSSYNGETIYVAFYQYASGSTYYGFGIDDVTIGYTEIEIGWNELYEPPDFETSLDLAFVIAGEEIPEGPVLNVDTGLTYFTIQEAIDDPLTLDGHTIELSAGNFDGGIILDKSLTLIGAGKDQTIINTSNSPVITVSADDAVIQNLGITDSPELGEGIRVVSPASSGLTVDNVAFTELGAGTGANAYGIYIDTSFSNLSVISSDFISAAHTTSYRTIGIFTPNSLNHNDFEIMDSTFTTIWTGIYLRSAIDGFVASGNLFESVQASDLTACVAGIYMGDGDDDNFDLENINIYENTFTEYGRGVYIWNYGENSVIDNLNIYDNLFENSIWSAAIRVIAGLGDDEQIAFQDILVDNNVFTQDSDVGAHVGLIDFRTYCALSSCDVTITNNDIALTGGPYTDPMSGILFLALEGPFTNTIIENNVLNGGNTGGAGDPPSSGILLNHQSSTFWPSDVLDMSAMYNNITDFENGVSIYDLDNSVYGGLSIGSMLDVNYNNIYGNTGYGIRNDEGESIDATCNWWGDISGPSGEGSGTGDAVSTNVTYLPWLDDVYPDGDCVGGVVCWNVDTGEYFGSIQDGIDDVDTLDGHTIEVFAGTHNETLTITGFNGLTLQGLNMPVISGSQTVWDTVRTTNVDNIIFVKDSTDVNIIGFEIKGTHANINTLDLGVFYENASGMLKDCHVDHNTLGDAYCLAVVAQLNSSLTVESCYIENYGRVGIYARVGTYLYIYNNTIKGPAYGPTPDNLPNYGIETESIDYANNLVIKWNEIYDHYNGPSQGQWACGGIYIDGYDLNYDGYPIDSNVSIEYNDIHDNEYGIYTGNNSLSYAHFNNIYDNFDLGVLSAGNKTGHYQTFDATCNWWGDITGPAHTSNPDGLGNNVSDYVTYLPWLDDVYPYGDCVGGLNEAPTAAFSYDPVDPTTVDIIQFTDESTDSDGTIVNWTWDFGDGTISYDQDPTHQFATADTYTVCLTVTDDDGATNTTCESIVVDEELIEVLDIEQAVQDRPFLVRHASDGDWGGAQNFTPTVTTITKVELYMKVLGTPTFDLTVELREDSIDGTLLDSITMSAEDFSSDWEWVEFDFADVTVAADTDYFVVLVPPPAGVTNTFGYGWGYSLGDTIDDSSLWFTRTSGSFWLDLPELYDFTFRVYGYEVFVDQPPTACFDWTDADGSGAGTMIDFDASCSTDDVGISTYEWDWENDGIYDATGVTQSYDFGDTDPHDVTLRVTDTIGQTDTYMETVEASAGGGVNYLLIPDSTSDTVGMYDPFNGTYLGDLINGAGIFSTPICAIQGPDDNIYVSDQVADSVFVFAPNGTYLSTYADASDGLNNIRGIDFRGNHLFVTSGDDYVAEFDGPHNRLPDFINDGTDPFDILFLDDGRSLLSDIQGSDNVRLYDFNGTFEYELFSVNFPEQTQVDSLSSGSFLTASFSEDTIYNYELDGTITQTTPHDSGRGIYRLGNGNLLATSGSGVFEIEPGTGNVIQTEKTGSARFIEMYSE